MHKEIAKIDGTFLGWEDHGIFTCYVYVNYGGGAHQGIGGYTLDTWNKEKGRIGTEYGMEFIVRLMRACGVDEWDKLKGRTIFAIKESDKWGAKVIGIEPLPTEDGKTFMFDDLAKEFGLK